LLNRLSLRGKSLREAQVLSATADIKEDS